MAQKHRVVIVGGGFGGLYAAVSLRRTPVEVTLVDRRNFHLFQPLLYQVATGALSPANIAAPLRSVLRRQRNARVLLAEVTDFNLAEREVILRDGVIPYDSLIVATGARDHYFGHPEWEKDAPGLKTIEDATEIRRRVLLAFEMAERSADPIEQKRWLTFVVVGGGPTGVELAGAVAELAQHTMLNNFRRINPASATVLFIEAADHVLTMYPRDLSSKAVRALSQLGVTVRMGTTVTEVRHDQVVLCCGDKTEMLPTHTILWGAGVQASTLAGKLGAATGAQVDRSGRVHVQADLTLPGHPEVFAIGDMCAYLHQGGKLLPGVAQVAMQQARYAANLIQRRLKGQQSSPFVYKDRGSMATIGRSAAVADLGWVRFSGLPAWLAWLFIHLLYIITFENRVLVLCQWAWNYVTRGRSARLITGNQQSPTLPGQANEVG